MSTVNQDELKAIKVLKFEGKESEWERWSEKFVALARARGFAGILLGSFGRFVRLGDLFCQLNGTEQGSFVTKI